MVEAEAEGGRKNGWVGIVWACAIGGLQHRGEGCWYECDKARKFVLVLEAAEERRDSLTSFVELFSIARGRSVCARTRGRKEAAAQDDRSTDLCREEGRWYERAASHSRDWTASAT